MSNKNIKIYIFEKTQHDCAQQIFCIIGIKEINNLQY